MNQWEDTSLSAAAASDAGGYPAANYLLAEEATRPHFSPPSALQDAGTAEETVLIIGAGFTGLCAALHLAEYRGSSRIILVDESRIASGPSGKSAGHVCGLQISDDATRRHCGPALAARLIAAAAEGGMLVRQAIARHAIPCDLRDGYVLIRKDGGQHVTRAGGWFGIAPYPFALGLAREAARRGVVICENVQVETLTEGPQGCIATTSAGTIRAARVLACGGHRMAERIGLLAPLRRRTTELTVGTILTEPLPRDVLVEIMPEAAGCGFPFANEDADVAYGSIDSLNRVVFGAHATAGADPSPERMFRTLCAMLPPLIPAFRRATGRTLRWQPLVRAEPLCFTRDFLPNVGAVGATQRILFVNALGGHGIALGTLLGKAAAAKLSGDRETGAVFDDFAAIKHGWLPTSQPWRQWAASLGLWMRAG